MVTDNRNVYPIRPAVTTGWLDHAACRGEDVDLFFPSTGADGQHAAREAKRICARCPVRDECLADAVGNRELWGIRGGLSAHERRNMHRGVKLQSPRSVCGTPAGYQRHVRAQEPACESCKTAHRTRTAGAAS